MLQALCHKFSIRFRKLEMYNTHNKWGYLNDLLLTKYRFDDKIISKAVLLLWAVRVVNLLL